MLACVNDGQLLNRERWIREVPIALTLDQHFSFETLCLRRVIAGHNSAKDLRAPEPFQDPMPGTSDLVLWTIMRFPKAANVQRQFKSSGHHDARLLVVSGALDLEGHKYKKLRGQGPYHDFWRGLCHESCPQLIWN